MGFFCLFVYFLVGKLYLNKVDVYSPPRLKYGQKGVDCQKIVLFFFFFGIWRVNVITLGIWSVEFGKGKLGVL